jgi:cellulose synthase/poly-beta-1,6-N-acetylglucosamine synthase-like glycosyltransferase
MEKAFVVHRWAATTYRFLQAKRYVSGITGANCALRTATLRQSESLNEPTSVGGDMHLAGQVIRMGHRIRFVAESEVAVHFEERFASYARQRSRWLGGILIHALPRREWAQTAVVAVFYCVGQAFVWLPLSVPLFGRAALAVWAAGVVCAILNRLRYLLFTSARTGVPMKPTTFLAAPLLVPLDLLALAYAPIDMLARARTKHW